MFNICPNSFDSSFFVTVLSHDEKLAQLIYIFCHRIINWLYLLNLSFFTYCTICPFVTNIVNCHHIGMEVRRGECRHCLHACWIPGTWARWARVRNKFDLYIIYIYIIYIIIFQFRLFIFRVMRRWRRQSSTDFSRLCSVTWSRP